MIKKFIALFLLCMLCVSLFGCNNSSVGIIGGADGPTDIFVESKENDEIESTITPMLYKVTDAKGNVAWLFGSIHLGEDDFYPLPDYVMNAYNNADALALEMDVVSFEKDEKAQQKYFYTPMKYDDGTTIQEHVNPQIYDMAVNILKEYGKYEEDHDQYMPVMWSSAIDQCTYEKMSYDMEKGIDRCFTNLAMSEGKEILEIESPQKHFSTLYNLSPQVQSMMLESSVMQYMNIESSQYNFELLVDAWKNSDVQSLKTMLSQKPEFQNDEQAKLYEEYHDALITQRDMDMTEFVKSVIEEKEVFVCVGTAHIVGENAMVDSLKAQGYNVEKVE